MKKAVRKNLHFIEKKMFPCKYCKISKNTYFEEHLLTDDSELTLRSDCFKV